MTPTKTARSADVKLMMLACLTLALLLALSTTMACDQKIWLSREAKQDASLDDLVVTETLLFQTPVASAVRCSRLCLGTPGCLDFTVVVDVSGSGSDAAGSMTSPVTCRGHRNATSSMATAARPGSRTFKYDRSSTWLNRCCVDDAGCPVASSTCFKGNCLCKPGTFYSESTDLCVPACGADGRGSMFLRYPGAVIYGYDLSAHAFKTEEECMAICRNNPNCLSADFSIIGTCFPNNVYPTVLWNDGDSNYINFQPSCL